jgi:predicted GTPase
MYNIVVLGNTGVGKSSLLNMLAGSQGAFIVGDRAYSETQLTIYKEFRLMGKPDSIRVRLVDTQGLSDSGGDTKDMQHIKNMVEKIRELDTIDLFLLCLDGTSPRFSFFVQTTISLFADIFPDFLKHTVLVFNKWISPKLTDKLILKNEYQELVRSHFSFSNIPCFFIDSFFNLKMLRDNEDGTQTERYLHYSIQERTQTEINALINHLTLKSNKCNVKKIIPQYTVTYQKEQEILAKLQQIKVEKENRKREEERIRIEDEQRQAEINRQAQIDMQNIQNQIDNQRRSSSPPFCCVS